MRQIRFREALCEAITKEMIMQKNKLTLVLLVSFYSCSYSPKEPEILFKEFTNINPQQMNLLEVKGEGAFAIPNFLSWGIFNYTCNKKYINILLEFDNYTEQSEFNTRFKIGKIKDFPANITYWTKNIKNQYKTNFNKNNCIYISGTNFPFINQILIDTMTHETLHLISGMSD
jgi:hypothetical protein